MKLTARHIAKSILPKQFVDTLRQTKRRLYPAPPKNRSELFSAREDIVSYEVQEGVNLDVFWKVLPIGKGPASALFVLGEEVLRFDCFGASKGHYHAAFYCQSNPTESRIYFPEQTVEAQIDRTIFELTRNLPYYLQRHRNPRIRLIQVDKNALADACESARRQMLNYLWTVPEFEALRK
jgi:hypothetical protein